MAEFTFASVEIKYIKDSIKIKARRNYSNNTFVGNPSSNDVTYISSDGKTINFTSIVEAQDITTLTIYRNLEKEYKTKPGVLANNSDLNINGNYYLSDYNEEKLVNGSYRIDWEFLEYLKPNKVQATFKRIGKPVTKKTTSKSTTKKKTSTYITKLLTDCKTMKKGQTNSKCVKYLQKFLQKKGYYKNCKIDGDYLTETKKAVKQLQKAYKIKVSKANQGVWDSVTRKYWRKKYNISSKKKTKKTTTKSKTKTKAKTKSKSKAKK